MRILTGVRGQPVCSAHHSKDGKLHGHTWTVVAWWDSDGACALEREAELNKHLASFDHRALGTDEAWGETLAATLLHVLECERVQVSRGAEGIYAVAER